jgi:glutamate-1-semialdehyde 2,1-aminomutase
MSMTGKTAADVARTIREQYEARTKHSRHADQEAKRFLPGGDTRSSSYYFPYPTYMREGHGCYVYDHDGNPYLDFFNNATSLIHGHGHPSVVSAAREQLEKGTVLGSPVTLATEHAALLCDRIPSVESVRYCNSGTEATLFAIRAARAFTGKDLIIKMDGGYHGTHDFVEVSIAPHPDWNDLPTGRLHSAGVPAVVLEHTLVVPFNELDALRAVLQKDGARIAGIIMEPMPARPGFPPPAPGYLEGVRSLADQYGVLLIFDEVQTFRLDLGGLQALGGVKPDLTALAKLIGGGFPVGAFGGRRDIMARFDPAEPQGLRQAGTFNGNPMTMAAGIAALNAYDAAAVAGVNELGDRLRNGFKRIFESLGIGGQATGLGSLVAIHWRDGAIRSARDAAVGARAARELPKWFHLEMMNRGVFMSSGGNLCTSTPMSEQEIDRALAAFEAALDVLKPYMAERVPHLLKE